MTFIDILNEQTQKVGIKLSELQLEQFNTYFENVVNTNKVMNLTGITEPKEFAAKHIIDCLNVYDIRFFNKNAAVCDVGSGAGFPGLPLKIYQPFLKVTLLDSLAKRINFLQQQIEQLALREAFAYHIRAEDAGNNIIHREKYDIVTARAVAPLSVLCEYCLPLVKVGGIFAAMKSKNAEQEINSAKTVVAKLGGKLIECKKVVLPEMQDDRVIIYYEKIFKTPKNFPRKAGIPEKNPII